MCGLRVSFGHGTVTFPENALKAITNTEPQSLITKAFIIVRGKWTNRGGGESTPRDASSVVSPYIPKEEMLFI